MAAQARSPTPVGDIAVSLLDVAIERTRALNKKQLLHRLIYVAKLSTGNLDKDDVGAHYEKFFKNLHNQNQHEEPFSGLLLIYPNQIVHIVESSMVMLIELMKDLHQADKNGKDIICDVKILLCSCNVSDRMYPSWNYRVLEKPAARMQEYKTNESIDVVVNEALTLLVKLGDHLNKIPKATSKAVLDNIQSKAGEFLIPNDMVEYLVNAQGLCRPADYLSRYTVKKPVDVVLESELVWPLPFPLLRN